MRSIAAAAVALALVAGAAHAQGNGNDAGGGHGNGHAAGPSMQGGGNGPGADHHGNDKRGGNKDHAERGNSGANAERGHDAMRVDSNDHGQRRADWDRGNDHAERGHDDHNRLVVIDDRGHGRGDVGVVRVRNFAAIPPRGIVTGCPPGLAKKNPPCVAPGQVRSPFRSFDRPAFWGLRLDDGRYRYDDGYLVRLAPDGRIGGYIPLLGGALAVGNPWPTYYEPVALPTYYESYYGLGPHDSYRYADNVIYQIDPETAAITSVIALLTGDTFAVGQPMPTGYDVYNVPYRYREQYQDTPEALYRYSDGYVYQVDPTTQLIAAAIELIA